MNDLKRKIMNQSSTISTLGGMCCVLGVAFFAIKDTKKAIKKIDEEAYNRRVEIAALTPFEILEISWKEYIPTMVMTTATMGLIFLSWKLQKDREMALITLVNVGARYLEYYNEVLDKVPKTEDKIRSGVAEKLLENNPVPLKQKEIVYTTTDQSLSLCFDSLSGRYFMSNIDTIKKAVNDFNYELLTDNYKPVNEFYELIGLEPMKLGRTLGWDANKGLLDIVYQAKIVSESNKPAIVLEYRNLPGVL